MKEKELQTNDRVITKQEFFLGKIKGVVRYSLDNGLSWVIKQDHGPYFSIDRAYLRRLVRKKK